jgi:hypothetical protein
MPEVGYMESWGGPVPLRDVEWVEVSTMRIKGGMAGRPLQFIDIKDEILAGLQGAQLDWEVRESTWSVQGVFGEEPVQVLRFANPFGPTPRPMRSFDHYREAIEIAQQLDGMGKQPVGNAIRETIASASTGTEIFMRLRGLIAPLKRETLPDFLAARVRRLWAELDAALK